MSPRWAIAAAVALAGWLAGALLLAPGVRIDPWRGDWAAVSEGLSPSRRAGAFNADRRAVVHFHELRAAGSEVLFTVSSRDHARLRVWRDGEALFDFEAPDQPKHLTIPVPAGARGVDVRLDAAVGRETRRPLYRIHEIALHRRTGFRWRMSQALPALVGLVVFLALWKPGHRASSVAWALLAAAGTIGFLVSLADPAAALRLRPGTRDALRLAGLAGLWVLALASPRPRAAAAAALLGTVGILYLPSLGFGFLNEDFSFARPWSWRELAAAFHGSWFPQRGVIGEYFRPLVSLSFAWDSWLWGARTEGYHLTNLAVHSVNGVLAFGLLGRLGLSPRGALAGALAFLAHPLGTTAAVWFSERTDGLMAAFYLAALVVVLSRSFTPRHAAGVLGLGALALGCKEMAVTLPLAAWLVARVAFPEDERRRRMAAMAGLALVAAYVALWAALFPHKLLALAGSPAAWEGFAAGRAANWLWLLPKLYAPVFAPTDYARWWTTAMYPLPAVLAFVLPALVCVLLLRSRGPAGPVSMLGLAWPLLTVAPILAISEVDLYRLGLLIGLGFGLWWGALLTRVEARSRWLPAVLAAGLVFWLAPAALKTAAAWGPGGHVMSLLPDFKRHFGPEWWEPLTPEMKRLFYEQLDRQHHAANWVREGARAP